MTGFDKSHSTAGTDRAAFSHPPTHIRKPYRIQKTKLAE
jgi:hypothetical protein